MRQKRVSVVCCAGMERSSPPADLSSQQDASGERSSDANRNDKLSKGVGASTEAISTG